MRADRILLLAAVLSFAGISASWAQLTPGPSAATKQAAVQSEATSQINTNSYFTVKTITSVIQNTFDGTGANGLRQNADDGTRLELAHRGMAASADSGLPMQVWLDAGGGSSKNSLGVGGYTLNNYGSQIGFQAEVTPTLVLGVSGSWQHTYGSLNGGFSTRGNTYGVSPYLGWQFDEHWNLSALAGYNQGTTRLSGQTTAYNASFQSGQWNYQAGLNGSYIVGPVRLAPVLSMLYTQSISHSFVDSTGAYVPGSNTALARGSAGGAVSLPMTGWEPYLRASFEHDFSVPAGSSPNGDTGGTIGAGVTVTLSQAIWFSLDAGYNSIGRTGLSLWSTDARVNFRF